MADEGRSTPKVAVARSSPTAADCSSVTVRREKARAAVTRPTLPRVLDFREDIIDGFAIVSFTDARDLEAFTNDMGGGGCLPDSSQRYNASVSSTVSQEDSDDGSWCAPPPPPSTILPPHPYSEISALRSSCSEDENENESPKVAKGKTPLPRDSSAVSASSQETKLCSCIATTTATARRLPATTTSSVSLLHPLESNNKTAAAAANRLPADLSSSSAASSLDALVSPLPVCFNILPREKSMVVGLLPPGCSTSSSSSSLDYLSSTQDGASLGLPTTWRCNGDDILPGGRNGSAAAAAVSLHGGKPSPALSEKATLSPEAARRPSSRPISVDDLEERLTPLPNGSVGDGRCRLSPKKRILDDAGENRRKVPLLDREEERFRYYNPLVDVGGGPQGDHTKVKESSTPSSLANCDETKIKSKKSKFRDLPASHALQSSRVQCENLPGVIATNTGMCTTTTTESQPLAIQPHNISYPFSSRLGRNSSDLSSGTASIPCKSEHRSDISLGWSSRSSATRSVDLVTSPKRSSSRAASTQVRPSNAQDDPAPPHPLPERESVIVREHSGHHHHRPAPSSSVKRECHSPVVSSSYRAGSRNSELRTPVSANLPHISTSTSNFPLFSSLFNKPLSVNSHPIYLPAPHPAFPSNFSASGLPFSLPPFQRAGMFAPSLGFPPSSSLMTSPLMGFASHFPPETMLALSASAPSQEILTRIQQELNTRFLQDRGILPMAPFTLHAEMHQHQHLHHHQHLLPGNYLPPPANPLLSSDGLTLGKLPPGGGLLQSSQNLSEFLEREQLAKAAGLPSYSSFHSLPLVGGLPTAMPFGSGLSGAFQPKPGLSSLNLTPATQLLLSLRDRDPFSAPANQLPPMPKKHGQWCAAHIHIAYKIHKMKQCQPDDPPRSHSSLKSLDRDRHPNHSYLLPSGGNGSGSMLGDMRSSSLMDSGLPPPFGRPPNFGGYDSLDLPFARKHAFDSTLNPSIFRSSGWNGLAPPPPAPPVQPSMTSGGWTKPSSDGSRESSGQYNRIVEQKERGVSSLNHKIDARVPGRDLHKDSDLVLSSRPTSHSNSTTHERKRGSPATHQPHKENGQFRSRSRSPLQFPTSRSYAPPNGPGKQSRDPEDMLWKPELRVDGFPNFRLQDSGGTNHSSLPPMDPYSLLGKTVEAVPHPIDLQHLSMAREPVLNSLNDLFARDQLIKDQAIFADYERRRQAIPPPLRSADLYFGHIYRPPSDRLYARDSPLPMSGGMGLPPPLVGANCSRPSSPISSLNHWMANGRSNSMASSASLIEIPNDSGRILR